MLGPEEEVEGGRGPYFSVLGFYMGLLLPYQGLTTVPIVQSPTWPKAILGWGWGTVMSSLSLIHSGDLESNPPQMQVSLSLGPGMRMTPFEHGYIP